MANLTRSAWKVIPQFNSTSIPRTIDFYTKDLHFTLGGTHSDGDDEDNSPTFCSVYIGKKADANIYFFETDINTAPAIGGGDEKINSHSSEAFHPSSAMIALGTAELDDYYDLLLKGGTVQITRPIKDEVWGYRQFTVRDLDGNQITFFKFLEGGNPRAG